MNILITGAAGSIGSELVRKLIGQGHLILFDISELGLYELDLELREDYNFTDFSLYLGNVCNPDDVNFVYAKFKPEITYHVAAYKHVPMMEINPRVAFTNNVWGIKIMADICRSKKFIYVSSDKAVNPTNVMGATKRLAEMYVQSRHGETKFITTRFGNVLESSGSVIPRWKKQKSRGRDLTITHKDVERYFMSIPEAADLVIQAGKMGKGNDIFTFDMGEPVKIDSLARAYGDSFVYIGLRPGEKLYEEPLHIEEGSKKTKNPKIFVSKCRKVDGDWVNWAVCKVMEDIYLKSDEQIVKNMKEILYPDFKSKNSPFEALDELVEKSLNVNDDLGCPQ
jgi:FlaA1/EpsC-like NDP-sugar epimerase